MEDIVRRRIAEVSTIAPGSIGDQMAYRLLTYSPEHQEYILQCKTLDWMRNAAGTLHGGMCATVVDQAMGFIAYCVKPGEGIAPTVQMQVNYQRPLIPGEDVRIRVRVISVTKSLMHLYAEAAVASEPDKICLTSTGVYFFKPVNS